VALVVLATVHPNYQLAELVEELGSTTRHIAVALLIRTELRLTGLAVRLAETRYPIVRLVQGNRLANRAAIWPAIAEGLA